MRTGTAGVSVVEALVALVLGLLLVQLALGVLVRERAAERRLSERGDGIAAVLVTRDVLGTEVRRGRPGRDWRVAAGDSLVLRAFRGVGRICPWRPTEREILVSYQGQRSPDPAKDSVLLLDADGGWWARALEYAGTSDVPCPQAPEVPVRRWRLAPDVPEHVVLARVFEQGSYHLAAGALRYRRGDGGRQPLTPEVLHTPPSAFEWSGGVLSLSLVTGEEAWGRPVLWRPLLWRGP